MVIREPFLIGPHSESMNYFEWEKKSLVGVRKAASEKLSTSSVRGFHETR